MKESKVFLKNTLMTLSRQISSILIGLLSTIIIARMLGPNGNGMYQLIVLLPTFLMTFLNFGVGTSSVYLLGKNKYPLNIIFKTNLFAGLFLSLISVIIGFIVVFFLNDYFFEGVPEKYLYLILFLMPLLLLNEFFLVIFQGKQDFKSFNFLALMRQITALLSLIIFIILFKVNIIGAVISFIIGVISQFILTLFLLRKRFNISLKTGEFSKKYFREAFSYGYKAHFSNILSFLNYRADIFIISLFITPAAVGIYSVAVNISERLWIVSQAISAVLFPKVSSLNSDDDKNRLTSIISRNVFLLSIFFGIIFYLLCELVILILFGKEYLDSATVLKILLPGIILFSVDRILSNDLAGRGKPEINMYTSLFTVVSNIILNLLLVPIYGLSGAAISTSFTYSLSTLIKLYLFKKITSIPVNKLLLIQKEDIALYAQLFRRFKKGKG